MKYLKLWERPEFYAGFNPEEDYLLAVWAKTDHLLDQSNWETIGRDIRAVAARFKFDKPEERMSGVYAGGISPRSSGWVYTWSAGCSLRGSVDYMMIRGDAPQAVIDMGEEILESLEDYCVYDEGHFGELEEMQACEFWESMSIRERADVLREARYDGSIFAARHPYPPSDDTGAIREILNGY
jgi:hypothetical protein